jgi:hypothetical protein
VWLDYWNATNSESIELPFRECTLNDFNIGKQPQNDSLFFKPLESKIPEFERIIQALKCIDSVNLQGD